MGLSPKQLRLVFAKLRAKGLLKYTKKGRNRVFDSAIPKRKKTLSMFGQMQPPVGSNVSVIDAQRAEALIARLPEKFMNMHYRRPQLLFGDNGQHGLGYGNLGQYRQSPLSIKIRKDAGAYSIEGASSFAPGSTRSSALFHRRVGTLGSAKTFYHEWGHYIDLGEDEVYLSVSTHKPWQDIVQSGEWLHMYGKGPVHQESFAEAFSMYASTKFSKNTLKKERPLAYQYMKKFFEEK